MPTRRDLLLGALAIPMIAGGTAAANNRAAFPGGRVDRIAFGSCAKQWEPQPIWDTIAAAEPDLFIFLGDAIYGDWDGEKVFQPTVETLKRDWDKLADILEFRRFRAQVPIMATWDNHDYGKHDGGAEFTLKEESKALFLDFFGEPAFSERRARSGVYDAKVFGPDGHRVQVILLDTRTFKDPYIVDERSKEEKARLSIRGQYLPNDDPGATLLGAPQWHWLSEQLRKPVEVRLIASSTQVVADEKAMEEWGNFPLERRRLIDLIAETQATGVVLLSGNVHFAEISLTDEVPYPLYDFTSSGMTHVNPDYAMMRNSRRVAGPIASLNFGLIEIDWRSGVQPLIRMSAIGTDGERNLRTDISVDLLRSPR